MKLVIVAVILFSGLAAGAEVCKKGDVKDCAKVLKTKEGSEEFNSTYEQVCSENKTFKCLKRTVRGDIKEELNYMKDEFPKAHLFKTKENGEEKVFVLDKK